MTQTAPNPATPAAPTGGYQRVDAQQLEVAEAPAAAGAPAAPAGPARAGGDRPTVAPVRWVVLPLSVLLCIAQAVATIVASNTREMFLTTTLIPVLAFAVLFLTVLGVNPLLRLVSGAVGRWARPLNRVELTCLFTAMLVTAGISTFGLTEQFIPLLAAPNNPEWNTPTRGWSQQLVPSMNPKLYIQDPAVISTFRQGVVVTRPDGTRVDPPRPDAPLGEKVSYGIEVVRRIPWMAWLTPMSYWLAFVVGGYGIFYFLTYILLGYWSDREKLIFPLVRFAEALLPDAAAPGATRTRIPALLRSPLFWVGFGISFGVWAWNACIQAQWLNGLTAIPLGLGGFSDTVDLLKDTIFQGLASKSDEFHIMFLIIFTAIGIAFLLPLEISFSVWFYYLVGRFIMLVLVWTGRGQNIQAFPSDFMWRNNPVTALGGGAIFLFSAVSLFRCTKDYAKRAIAQTGGRALALVPVFGLLLSMFVVTAWLAWNRLPILWAMVFVACLTLLTVGLMRIVAESGIYWFQAHTSFFHMFHVFGLGKVLSSVLVAPLLPIYSVLFLDIKTFMAPNLLNAAEMEKNSRVGRFKFHLNLLVCILVSVVVSLCMALFLAHLRGAHAMEGWFYNDSSPWILDTARNMISDPPAFDLTNALWYAAGAVWVAISMLLRTSLFWFPHPAGLIMLINPLMTQVWFSFFLGWACKKAAVKYGGKTTFDTVRGLFIGLIAGELMAIFFWTVVSVMTGVTISVVSINRY